MMGPRDRIWMVASAFIVMAILSLSTGCSRTDGSSPSTPQTTEKPATIPTAAATTSVIEYSRRGGFAGLDDHLSIDSSREVTITRRTGPRSTFVLDQETYDRILRQFEQGGFAEMGKEYLPVNTCCDLIEYEVTYKSHTVRTMDTAVPESMQPLILSLNDLIDNQRMK